MKLQSLTLLSLAATALAVNFEQIRLINEDALVLDGTQFNYPVLGKINEQDEFKETGKKKAHKKNNNNNKDKKKKKTQKKEKKSTKTTKTTLTTLPPSSTPSLSFTKVTSIKHSSKTSSETTTSSKHESSSKSHSRTASITKTNGGDSVVISIGGPIALALGLLL